MAASASARPPAADALLAEVSWPSTPPLPRGAAVADLRAQGRAAVPSESASYKKQAHNPGTTEIIEIPDRGHALTIDSGWRKVADTAPDFIKRFV
jgi:hypothetical protein